MRVNLTQNIAAADASKDEYGSVISCAQMAQCSAQAVVTGTSTGTLYLQVSNDPYVAGVTPANWSNLATSIAVSGAGVYLIPKTDLCYSAMRAYFAHTNAAAGTITVSIADFGV